MVSEHGASDVKEPVSDGAKGPAVSMTALPEGGVLSLAAAIMLHGHPGPMIKRPAEPGVAGKPSGHDAALAGALGHRRRATKCPQSLIVSALQRLPAFCEQRGEDDPAVS